MFINDVHRKDEVRNIAVQHLKKHGIKFRPKKPRTQQQMPRTGKKCFKVPLQNLETVTVTLTNGQQLVVPKRVHEMCSFILTKVQTEGIFRKEGSKARQQEIKSSLDKGHALGDQYHVIDVAVILKSFLRELPEPLIPPALNDLFLMCSLEKRSRDEMIQCLHLACLLLPSENLNVLAYLMQFFNEVASFSDMNKMTNSNLSILVGPNIFPMDDKLVPKSSLIITRICDITKLLMENSINIGLIPDYIINEMGQTSDVENEKKRKNKRRSGMFNGLKKIVSNKTEEDTTCYDIDKVDGLATPTIRSMKKAKGENGLSLKRKKEVLTKLPDHVLLNVPFTPSKTPVCANPNGSRIKPAAEDLDLSIKEKKLHWYMRSRSMKSLKQDDSIASASSSNNSSRRNSMGPKSLLERRWSAVSNAANFRRKKRTSCVAPSNLLKTEETNELDYVCVSKLEYEEFKNRVSAIERRISLELDNVQVHINENDNNVNRELDGGDIIENVQSAYEKTLESSQLSPTTDQLARRLSRDLRIRRSAEQKIIRSPSARKIGTIRRRSTEREKRNVARNQVQEGTINAPLLPRVSLRKKKTLAQEKSDSGSQITPVGNLQRSTSFPKRSSSGKKLRKVITSPSGFSTSGIPCGPKAEIFSSIRSNCDSSTNSGMSEEHWEGAESFFSTRTTPQDTGCSVTTRASIAKLRSQNVGMVRAKARLFDHVQEMTTPETSSISQSDYQESGRAAYRVKVVRTEERRLKKNSASPRRRQPVNGGSQRQKLQQIGKIYMRSTRESNSPRLQNSPDLENTIFDGMVSPKRTPRQNMPRIKGSLVVKTPKRLCRTPAVDKKTPFKIMATPL